MKKTDDKAFGVGQDEKMEASIPYDKISNPVLEKDFSEVNDLIANNHVQDADSLLGQLLSRYRADGQWDGYLRAIMQRSVLKSREEDGYRKAIDYLNAEAGKKSFPVSDILNNVLAITYQAYLDANQHRLGGVTEGVASDASADFQTWSVSKLQTVIRQLFFRSIENPQLRDIPIQNIDLVITPPNSFSDAVAPTLYDFLAHNVLEYMANDRNYTAEPVYKFTIRGDEWFAPWKEFTARKIESRDTSSNVYNSLMVFRQLLSHHDKKNNEAGLRFTDLRRLKFVYDHSVDPQKTAQFTSALDKIIQQGNKASWKADYIYEKLIAQQLSDRYDPAIPESDDRLLLKRLVPQFEQLIKDYPGTNAAKKAASTLRMIKTPGLTLESERIQIPGKPFLMLANYNNVTNSELLIYQISESFYLDNMRFNRRDQEKWWKDLKTYRRVPIQLPNFDDFRFHKVEFKVDALPEGIYLFTMQSPGEEYFNYQVVQASNLLVMGGESYGRDAASRVITDRTGGAPLQGVKAALYEYNYRNGKVNLQENVTSDKNGFVNFNLANEKNYFSTYKYGKDALIDFDNFSFYNYNSERIENLQATFFLDRAIYRPGQTVYYKAILFKTDENGVPKIDAGRKTRIVLRDVNGQEVTAQSVTSNEYGSVKGSFTLPSGLLTGSMRIHYGDNYGIGFQVEEYKRPKFEVRMDTVIEAYVLGDEVTIRGQALNYAGNPLDNAEVSYTVRRVVRWRYPYPWFGGDRLYRPGRKIGPRGEEMIIVNGTTVTDAQGRYSVTFKALTDESVSPASKPRFDFRVTADITDINGETQSGSESISIGYDKYDTEYSAGQKANVSQMQSLKVITRNSAGTLIPVTGRLIIERLQGPGEYLRPKLYSMPDEILLDKDQYKRLWPYEPWMDETDMTKWAVSQTVFDEKITSGDQPVAALKNMDFKSGMYRLRFDIEGQDARTAKTAHYTRVHSESNGSDFEFDKLSAVHVEKETYQPGEKATLSLAARNPSGKMLYRFSHQGKVVEHAWLDARTLVRKIISIQEQYRGGIAVSVTTVGYSRVESQAVQIAVPWINKDLIITLNTFRDKLQPGQEESWELHISGPGKDKITAEVLASMYDQSLDAFVKADYSRIGFPGSGAAFIYRDNHNALIHIQSVFEDRTVYDEGLIPGEIRRFREDLIIRGNYGHVMYRYNSRDGAILEDKMVLESQAAPPGGMAESARSSGADMKQNEAGDASEEAAAGAGEEKSPPPAIRQNLEETVFFYPTLYTDAGSNVIVRFKMKEALTRWKFRVFAHTKELKQGYLEREVTTSKELMVFPNLPRFLRESDEMELTAKVTSMNGLGGVADARLELLDAVTMQPLAQQLFISEPKKTFTLAAGQSSVVTWRVKAPLLPVEAVAVRITAQTAAHSDGEENILPVVPNRMMVTETMPLPVRAGETRQFTFLSMLEANKSSTIQPYRFTLEYTSNPVWYAIQALPYLMEFPHECTEQILNRYYANSLATHVANSTPRIKAIFDKWRNSDALLSNLQKNQELKNALLEETPWVLEAKNEEQQKKNIALLFDLNRMAHEQASALDKILDRQSYNGGLPWFPGSPENEYVTSYVIENLGHLSKLGVTSARDGRLKAFILKAIQYCDSRMEHHYNDLKRILKNDPAKLKEDHLGYWAVQYLYARSFFPDAHTNFGKTEAYKYYRDQSKTYWNKRNHYAQGMISLFLARSGESTIPATIVEGLRQTATVKDEMGMYWHTAPGYFWYEHPVETQALMIEVFTELTKNQDAIDDMKVWLLKNKQTNNWKTTKATSNAIYALLYSGGAITLETTAPEITLGQKPLNLDQIKAEAGTGYFKTSWSGKEIQHALADIRINNRSKVVNWGAAYYQFFEQMDKIRGTATTPLTIEKVYYIVSKGDKGETIRPVTATDKVGVGEKVRVRTIIKVDRPMEFVHLKDMRPAGLEPVNVLSGYRWKNGLGYYESTKDIATHFFMDYLPVGTWIFEYDLRASLRGDFSTGISTIQCMYAPEFSSHSKGERFVVK